MMRLPLAQMMHMNLVRDSGMGAAMRRNIAFLPTTFMIFIDR